MGGSQAGDQAAQIAIDTFMELLEQPLPTEPNQQYDSLLQQCYLADERIREKAYQSFQTLGMGTTIVAAIITPKTCIHVYAWDSRLYHFRNGELKYQTADHSIVRLLVEIGRITPEQIPTHPMRAVINSCLGGRNADGQFSIDPKWNDEDPPIINLQPNDFLILCTDGLHTLVLNEELEKTIHSSMENPDQLADQLVELALDKGGLDNITILTLLVKES